MMLANKAKVLLVLPQDVLDGAWALAGTATTTFKLPVSGQIVLRALIEEGLKRDDQNLFANIEGQAQAVRRIRSLAGRVGRGGRMEALRSEIARRVNRSEGRRRGR
jgi:hypothetical protein